MPETFRVNLYRKPAVGGRPSFDEKVFPDISASGTAAKTDAKTCAGTKNKSTGMLLRLIRGNPSITLTEMAEKTGLSKSGVRYALGKMREQDLLERVGTRKEGKWTLR
ncbi:MAG: MarR family transcriptional regulator [Thermoguttaceae bacterium]|nr:MarR family transcriptional regulator [Thermoguttaceae bacterium]